MPLLTEYKLVCIVLVMDRPIDKALAACGGNQSELARRMGGKVRQAHVWHWLKTGVIPAERCRAMERATGIPANELRPDIFGTDSDAA